LFFLWKLLRRYFSRNSPSFHPFSLTFVSSYSKGVSSAARRIRKALGAAEVESLADAITLAAISVCNDVILVLVKTSEKKKVSVDVRAGDTSVARALCEAAIAALSS
jgi:hypothetical protein